MPGVRTGAEPRADMMSFEPVATPVVNGGQAERVDVMIQRVRVTDSRRDGNRRRSEHVTWISFDCVRHPMSPAWKH